jgi:hypothetical protein
LRCEVIVPEGKRKKGEAGEALAGYSRNSSNAGVLLHTRISRKGTQEYYSFVTGKWDERLEQRRVE